MSKYQIQKLENGYYRDVTQRLHEELLLHLTNPNAILSPGSFIWNETYNQKIIEQGRQATVRNKQGIGLSWCRPRGSKL